MAQPKSSKDRKFVNGLFVKRVWVDPNDSSNELFGLGVKKKDFLQNIQSIQEDENGFINLSMGSQKEDRDKFSVWQKEPKESKPTTKASTPAPVPAASNEDDLPF